ncbi:MAG: tetratricopeptide repeat protein [Deltaproteobacteria bacterium]|nr:tetratricopeptide repeat protein [Deltaproteobacteria bacterium]
MPSRLETLEALCARAPADPFPYYCLAQEYRSQKRAGDALAAFGRLRDRFPEYVPQYLMAAQLCVEEDNPREARAWLTQGIAAARAKRDAHAQGELEALLQATPEPP